MSRKPVSVVGDGSLDFAAPAQPPGSTSHEVDFLQLAIRFKWLLVGGLLGGLLLGEMGYRKLGPHYEAVSQILVSKKVEVPIKDGPAGDFGARGEHIALIMSPMIVGQALKEHKLNELPTLASVSDPIEEILDGLKVKRSAGQDRSFLNVLDISYRSPNPNDSTKVVTAIIEEYENYLKETQKQHSEEVARLITEANQNLVKQLRQKEQKYLEFRLNSPLYWKNAPGAKGVQPEVTNVHRERMLEIERERRQNMIKQAQTTSRIKSLEEAQQRGEPRESLEQMVRLFVSLETGASTAANIQRPPEQLEFDSQLLPLLLEQEKLRRDFGEDHPDVQTVRKSIQTLIDFYRHKGVRLPEQAEAANAGRIDFAALYVRSLKQVLAELKHREIALNTISKEETKLAKGFTRFLLKDQALNDEIQRIKTLWQAVVDQLNKVNLTKNTSGYSLKQIAPVRCELVFKRHLKFLLAGCAAGALAMLAIAYMWVWQDTTFRSVEDIRNSLDLPMLGAIPKFKPLPQSRMISPEHANLSPALCYFHRPGSTEAEAYRSVRTALYVCTRSQGAKVIQVSSPVPGDGKTTFVANLAVAMAQSGKSVLLIDADLRRPTIHTLLGVKEGIGMSDVLAGEIEFLNAVKQTSIDGLSLLMAGATPANPSELLSSIRFRKLLDDAKNEFDFVLLDTPPLLVVSDPCVVAPQTDGVLLVLRLLKSKRASALRAADLLEIHAVNVLGVVANGVLNQFDEADGDDSYTDYFQSDEQTLTHQSKLSSTHSSA